jgi:hypothetical protein
VKLAVFIIVSSFLSRVSMAADLKQETIEAFDHYVTATEARLEPQFHGEHFLWFDQSEDLRRQLLHGAIVVKHTEGNGIVAVKGGLIQDSIGAVYVPNTNLKTVLALLQDYDRHAEIYKPDIQAAKVESRNGNEFVVHARVLKAKFLLSVVLNIDNEVQFVPVDSKRVYSRSASRRVAEVTNPGRPNEHELPVGRDRGFLWRINGYRFFEERDGGVYITSQSITLTRDIPFVMAKLFSPIVHELPEEALRTNLEQTRRGIAPDSTP